MKKIYQYLVILILCLLVVPISITKAEPKTVTVELTIDNPLYLIDGQPQESLEYPFFIIDGRTMSPPRIFYEAFKINIEGGYPKEVILKSKNIVIVMPYNNKKVIVNGKEEQIDVPISIRSGRTAFPVRFIMETFGATVTWDPLLHKATIVYEVPDEKTMTNNTKIFKKTLQDQVPLSSYQFVIGSKIAKITEFFKPGKGEVTLKYPIQQKMINGVLEYFVSEDDIHMIFSAQPFGFTIKKDKEYETYWFSTNNRNIHFKWKIYENSKQFDEEVFVDQEKTTWRNLPYEETFLIKTKSIKKVVFPVQIICELLDYNIQIDEERNKIIIQDIFGKTQTITIGSLIVSYEQVQGPIECDFYLNSPIIINNNRSMIDIQPLLWSAKFPTYCVTCYNDQFKPYNWKITYCFLDKNKKQGVFIEHIYSMPGKEKIWTDDFITYDEKEINWIVKPLMVGKSRVEPYELKSNILVPLRTYFEMVGYDVIWDQSKNLIIAKPYESK